MPLSSSLSTHSTVLSTDFLHWAESKRDLFVRARREGVLGLPGPDFVVLVRTLMTEFEGQPFAHPSFHGNLDSDGRVQFTVDQLRRLSCIYLSTIDLIPVASPAPATPALASAAASVSPTVDGPLALSFDPCTAATLDVTPDLHDPVEFHPTDGSTAFLAPGPSAGFSKIVDNDSTGDNAADSVTSTPVVNPGALDTQPTALTCTGSTNVSLIRRRLTDFPGFVPLKSCRLTRSLTTGPSSAAVIASHPDAHSQSGAPNLNVHLPLLPDANFYATLPKSQGSDAAADLTAASDAYRPSLKRHLDSDTMDGTGAAEASAEPHMTDDSAAQMRNKECKRASQQDVKTCRASARFGDVVL